MENVERRISTNVQNIAQNVESALLNLVRLASIPLSFPGRFVRFTLPPTLHIVLFLSLLPALLFFSVSSGILVARWLPSGWVEPVFLQYGEGITPYAYIALKNLVSDQPYDIILQLTLPLTESNYALGNFMTSVTLLTMSNRTISASRRPALVPPRNSLRLIQPTTTTINIPLYHSTIVGYSNIRAKVEVGRSDGWRSLGQGDGQELAVVEAHLKGIVRLKGLRSMMAMSPTFTAIATAALFFFTSTFIAFLLYVIFSPTFTLAQTDQREEEQDTYAPPATRTEGKSSFRTSSKVERKPSREAPERRPSREVKIEKEEEPMELERERMLRRRRSRASDRSASASSSSRVPPL